MFLSVFICFYLFLSVFICFYLSLSIFICFYLFLLTECTLHLKIVCPILTSWSGGSSLVGEEGMLLLDVIRWNLIQICELLIEATLCIIHGRNNPLLPCGLEFGIPGQCNALQSIII